MGITSSLTTTVSNLLRLEPKLKVITDNVYANGRSLPQREGDKCVCVYTMYKLCIHEHVCVHIWNVLCVCGECTLHVIYTCGYIGTIRCSVACKKQVCVCVCVCVCSSANSATTASQTMPI